MTPIQGIFSYVQSAIGDLAMDRVHIGQYVDFANMVITKVAAETEIYISRYVGIPYPSGTTWNNVAVYTIGSVVELNSIKYIAIVDNQAENPVTGNSWVILNLYDETGATTYNPGQYIECDNKVYLVLQASALRPPVSNIYSFVEDLSLKTSTLVIPNQYSNNIISAYKFIKVSRGKNGIGFSDAREYSMQAIRRTQSGQTTFGINDTVIGENSFATSFTNNFGNVDGSIALLFPYDFEIGEMVIIDYISNKPFTVVDWMQTPTINIPEFLVETIKFGILYEVCTQLYFRGDETFANKMQVAKAQYDLNLRSAVGYSRMLRNNNSTLQMQPINWLGGRNNV